MNVNNKNMKNLSNYKVVELTTDEKNINNGGFLITIAAICTIIWVAGHIAEEIGESAASSQC